MKTLGKFAAVIAFVAVLFGGLQTASALSKTGSLPMPSPIAIPTLKSYKDFDLNPKPGFDVTLLMSQTVRFEWNGEPMKNFVIKDSNGKKIFEQANVRSVDINPAKLKLKPGKKYSWTVNDNARVCTFTILDEQTEKELLDNLAEIDAEKLSADERVLKKAIYLQQLSEYYPEQFDLYWLSAQWMSEISPTEKNLQEELDMILERCVKHLNDEM